MIIEERLLTKNKYSRPGVLLKAVRGVVIHWVANPGSTALANRDYFEGLKNQTPPDDKRFASAHYVIGIKGEIIRCVPDKEVCYHAGAERYTNEALRRLSSQPNNCTVGIELCHPGADGRFTGETLESCRGLVSALLAAHGLTRECIWRHYDVTGKICPKYFVERTSEWDAFRAGVNPEGA